MVKLNAILSRLSTRQRVLLGVTVALVCGAALERLVYAPVVAHLDELDQEILLKESQLRRNLRNIAAREAVRKAYAPYATDASTARSQEEMIGGLLAEIEGLAGKAGLVLANVRPKPASQGEGGKRYPVEVEFESELGPLVRFIHGLHGSKYLLRVSQLRLDGKGGRGPRVKVYLLINERLIQ